MPHAEETILERAAASSRTDAYAALAALAVVVAQLVGLALGIDLLRFVDSEWMIGLFGLVALARRKLVNGRGLRAARAAREDSHDGIPVPAADEVTAPLELPPDMAAALDEKIATKIDPS